VSDELNRLIEARDAGYMNGRADVLAEVEKLREWVWSERNASPRDWAESRRFAFEAVVDELDRRFPKAKEMSGTGPAVMVDVRRVK
jgi:hypothetical protein